MTTPEITRIKAALAAWNDADNGRQEDAALDLLHNAVGPEQMSAVLTHIDAQQ